MASPWAARAIPSRNDLLHHTNASTRMAHGRVLLKLTYMYIIHPVEESKFLLASMSVTGLRIVILREE